MTGTSPPDVPADSKLELHGARLAVAADEAISVMAGIFRRAECPDPTALVIAEHLADASLCGVESHGLVRALQYVEQFRSGYMRPDATPRLTRTGAGASVVDGGQGSGTPAIAFAYDRAVGLAAASGMSVLAIRNVGHTGRHGAYAERAAEAGVLTICTGGGNRRTWRQVAPHGGARGMLPTNPWCVGLPGGERGPVVMDFATSRIAGGWIYAARSAGALLPEGCVIDRHGRPTRDPEDYFNGGAILPSGGHKGYALALVGELIAEALLGPSTTECNWLLIAIEASRFREPPAIRAAAEEILAELRDCPPRPASTGSRYRESANERAATAPAGSSRSPKGPGNKRPVAPFRAS